MAPGFWRRFCGYLVDLVLLYAPLVLGDMVIRALITDPRTRSNVEGWLGGIVGVALFASYFMGLWMRGGTVGQRLFGLSIVGEDGYISIWQALSRLIALSVVTMLAFSVIGFIVLVANRLRGKPYWHDTVSRTSVINRQPQVIAS